MEGRFEAVLLDQRVLDLLAGDGGWTGEDVQAHLEGRVSLYLTRRGPGADQADRYRQTDLSDPLSFGLLTH